MQIHACRIVQTGLTVWQFHQPKQKQLLAEEQNIGSGLDIKSEVAEQVGTVLSFRM